MVEVRPLGLYLNRFTEILLSSTIVTFFIQGNSPIVICKRVIVIYVQCFCIIIYGLLIKP